MRTSAPARTSPSTAPTLLAAVYPRPPTGTTRRLQPRSSTTAKVSRSWPAAVASAPEPSCLSWPKKPAAPIVKPLLGKAVVPDRDPYTTGGIGLLGTAPSQDAMEECDTLVIARQQLPLHGVSSEARPGEVRTDRHTIRPASACVIRQMSGWSATARRALKELLPLIEHQKNRDFLKKAQRRMESWYEAAGRTRHAYGFAHEAASSDLSPEQATRRRCHYRLPIAAPSPPGPRATSIFAET